MGVFHFIFGALLGLMLFVTMAVVCVVIGGEPEEEEYTGDPPP